MTREEAVKIINCYDIGFYDLSGEKIPADKLAEAFYMAIEALKQVTGKLNNPEDSLLTADSEACKEQKSKLDLISRAEAIEAVRLETAKRGLLGRGDILDILSALPSADRPSADLISKADVVDAIESTTWYHQNRNKDMVSGANSAEHQAWYKADDVYKALEAVPPADRPRPIDPTIEVDLESGVVPRSACEPKGTKTIIYADRPKGEWTKVSHSTGGHVCSQCHWYASSYLSGDEYLSNFCPNCGADMRGEDK